MRVEVTLEFYAGRKLLVARLIDNQDRVLLIETSSLGESQVLFYLESSKRIFVKRINEAFDNVIYKCNKLENESLSKRVE